MLADTLWSLFLASLSSPATYQDLPLVSKPNQTKPFVVAVEGNVGSGKSTFLEILSNLTGVNIYPEPVNKWQNVSGQNLLHDIVREMSDITKPSLKRKEERYKSNRWTTTFQLYSSLTRAQTGYSASAPGSGLVSIMERSLYSERYCFVQMLVEAGVITPGEFGLLDRWFSMLTGRQDPAMKVDHFVYIRTDPAVLGERIRGRGRQEEDGINIDFLRELHNRHEAWFLDDGGFTAPASVTIIDGNLDLEHFKQNIKNWASTLPQLQMSN